MMVYIILLLILFYFWYLEYNYNITKLRKIYYIILVILSSIRYEVGSDYILYRTIYNEFPKDRFSEPIFNILFKILKGNNLEYQVIIMITSIVFTMAIYKYFSKKNVKEFWIGTLLYIITNYYFYSFNVFRQFTAFGLFLVGITKKRKEKYISYLMAYLTHKSILIMIIFSLILKKTLKRRVIFILCVLGILNLKYNLIQNIYVILFKIFRNNYIYYLNTSHNIKSCVEGTGLGIIFRIIKFLVISNSILKIQQVKGLSKKEKLSYNFFVLGEILGLFSYTSIILRRLEIIFVFFQIDLINIILKKGTRLQKKIIYIILLIILILYFKFLVFELKKQYLIYHSILSI